MLALVAIPIAMGRDCWYDSSMPRPRKPKLTKRQQVRDLVTQGYSPEAVSCILGLSVRAVRKHIEQAHLLKERPEGYSTVSEEAERLGCERATLFRAIRDGHLRAINFDGHWFTTAEWADIWYNNHPYRQRAKRLQEKLFAPDPPRPAPPDPGGPQ